MQECAILARRKPHAYGWSHLKSECFNICIIALLDEGRRYKMARFNCATPNATLVVDANDRLWPSFINRHKYVCVML